MRKPTPVTTRIMTAERGSSRNSAVATKSPAAIQVNRVRTTCLSSGARWIRLSTNPAATRNETPTDPQATREMTGLGSRFPSRPFMAEPKSGSAGTSQRKSIRLPLHDVRVVHTERVPVAVDSDCNGQPDGRFCRGNHHNKEDKDLTVNLIQVAGKRDEAQVDAVQHQFDAKKNGDDIFLHDHPDGSHREEERAQNQVRENAHKGSLWQQPKTSSRRRRKRRAFVPWTAQRNGALRVWKPPVPLRGTLPGRKISFMVQVLLRSSSSPISRP